MNEIEVLLQSSKWWLPHVWNSTTYTYLLKFMHHFLCYIQQLLVLFAVLHSFWIFLLSFINIHRFNPVASKHRDGSVGHKNIHDINIHAIVIYWRAKLSALIHASKESITKAIVYYIHVKCVRIYCWIYFGKPKNP